MAKKSKMFYEDDDSLYALRKEDERQWAEWGELAQEVFGDWLKWNDGTSGIPAKTWQDSGRGCVKCGDLLMIIEPNDAGDLLLQCRRCHTRQWLSDIAPYSEEEKELIQKEVDSADGAVFQHFPDQLYRTIPDSVVITYTELIRKRRLGS